MGFVTPSIAQQADSAIAKLRSGEATSYPDAARKARLGFGLRADAKKISEITAELGRRGAAAKQALREAKTRAEKIGQ